MHFWIFRNARPISKWDAELRIGPKTAYKWDENSPFRLKNEDNFPLSPLFYKSLFHIDLRGLLVYIIFIIRH